MNAPNIKRFRKDLLASRLVTAEQIADGETLLNEMTGSGDDDSVRLARGLVKKGHLTSYQAQLVLSGKTEGFFFGRYKILGTLGRGSMGRVYKAEDTALQRQVALKILPRNLATTPMLVARFMREGAASARLNHPNIVQAYDLGEENDLHYIAFEFVNGYNLKHVLGRKEKLSSRLTVHLTLQVGAGLEHAHEHGVIHRDLKPSNIMVDRGWHAKILDMGLARIQDDDLSATGAAQITKAGEVLGTFDYMAPEQAADTSSADTRSDIYSLGCSVYHMLTGRAPFPDGTGIAKIQKHMSEEPEPLETLVPDLAAGLGDIVRKMMAKSPGDRHQTPAELITDLKALQSRARSAASQGKTRTHAPSSGGPDGSSLLPGLALGSDPDLATASGSDPSLTAAGSSDAVVTARGPAVGSSTQLPGTRSAWSDRRVMTMVVSGVVVVLGLVIVLLVFL